MGAWDMVPLFDPDDEPRGDGRRLGLLLAGGTPVDQALRLAGYGTEAES